MDVVAYGVDSQRGRLRHATSLFASGESFLYTNPARRPSKLVDFTLHKPRSAVREDIHRFSHASLWSECIIHTHAGGDAGTCYRLYDAALDALEKCHAPWQMNLASARFLWRFLVLNGVRPTITHCNHCGTSLTDSHAYTNGRLTVLCANCHHIMLRDASSAAATANRYATQTLSPVLVHFFTTQINRPFEHLLSQPPPHSDTHIIREFVCQIVEHYIERELRVLRVLRQLA